MHGIDDCYQLTRTSGGFSAQCLSKSKCDILYVTLSVTYSTLSFSATWNLLPVDLRLIGSPFVFKKRLKIFLLDSF